MQLKLLRVLQEKEFERVGDSRPIKVDVRVVAATNRDLRKRILEGEFREDLYYRLKVVEISMPPLRENREDIPLLVDHFIRMFNRRFNGNIEALSTEVMQTFMAYQWPGNVRELEHALEHAFIVCKNSHIAGDHLPFDIRQFNSAEKLSVKTTQEIESKSIIAALDKSRWNITKAAQSLGVSRPTLYKKMRYFELYEN